MPARALDTDLYQLTMMAGYHAVDARALATFELFVRNLPRNRSFLVAAGLEPVLDYVEQLRFTPEQVEWLRASPYSRSVEPGFFEMLTRLRFTGDVWAVPAREYVAPSAMPCLISLSNSLPILPFGNPRRLETSIVSI